MKKLLTMASGVLLLVSGMVMAGGDPAAGKSKSATCAACHGADGNSPIATNPILAGQHQDYLLQALKDYKSGARNNPIMIGMVAPLSDQDMEDLAAYFASQSGLTTAD